MTAAIADLEAAVPVVQKAMTDCQNITQKKMKVGGLPECIADIEKLIPDVEKAIADFKAGNITQAIADIEAAAPIVQQAMTDCQAKKKMLKLRDDPDPKKYYFEKMGAQFARGFLAGMKVGDFDEVDLYECISHEPDALMKFVKADETVKESMLKKDPREGILGLDELIGFIGEMCMETWPHSTH